MNTPIEKEIIIKTEINKEKILFVCSGNTCRSPMCAALFNHKYAGLTRVGISAGLSADGSAISPNALFALREYGVKVSSVNDYKTHVSVSVDEQTIRDSSLVVGVTSAHALTLISRFPEYASKITSFSKDIFDPFGGDDEIYAYCLKTIDSALSEMFTEDKDEFHDN